MSWKFRLINFLTRDRLRVLLGSISYHLRTITIYEDKPTAFHANKAIKSLEEIWNL